LWVLSCYPDGAAAEAYCQAIRRGSRDRSSGKRMTEAASRLRKGAIVNPHHNLGRRKESQVFVSRPLPAAALALAMAVAAALVGQALAGDDPFGALSVYRQPWFALPSWGWVVVGIVYYLAMMFVVFRLLRRLPTASIALGVVVGVMIANEVWNVLVFGLQEPVWAAGGLIAFGLLVLVGVYLARQQDRVATWVLGGYAVWVIGYDIPWMLAVAVMN
jgi:benzodiazapine receptor